MCSRSVFPALAIIVLMATACQNKAEKKTAPPPDVTMAYEVLAEGVLEVQNDKFWTWIPRDGQLEILAEGHDWTEGPLWVPELNALLYTDIPRNAVYQWKEGAESKVYLQPSGFLGEGFTGEEPGANGLLLDASGALVLCQHGERRVARMKAPLTAPAPEFEVLAATYEGKRFNSPNDAVFHSDGSLFFTDPPYGLPKRMEDSGKELDFQGVYRFDPDGTITLLTTEFSRPNGIALSPDESTLYVANSDPGQAIWKAFDVGEGGKLENGRLFYDATSLVGSAPGLPDGMVVADTGTIFASGPGGIFVFSPEAQLLGRILTGQATSNCTLNADQSALYITADSYLLRLQLK